MLKCIELIEEYLKDTTIETFLSNTQLQDAIVRRIELIDEAVKNIHLGIKCSHPEIQWGHINT